MENSLQVCPNFVDARKAYRDIATVWYQYGITLYLPDRATHVVVVEEEGKAVLKHFWKPDYLDEADLAEIEEEEGGIRYHNVDIDGIATKETDLSKFIGQDPIYLKHKRTPISALNLGFEFYSVSHKLPDNTESELYDELCETHVEEMKLGTVFATTFLYAHEGNSHLADADFQLYIYLGQNCVAHYGVISNNRAVFRVKMGNPVNISGALGRKFCIPFIVAYPGIKVDHTLLEPGSVFEVVGKGFSEQLFVKINQNYALCCTSDKYVKFSDIESHPIRQLKYKPVISYEFVGQYDTSRTWISHATIGKRAKTAAMEDLLGAKKIKKSV